MMNEVDEEETFTHRPVPLPPPRKNSLKSSTSNVDYHSDDGDFHSESLNALSLSTGMLTDQSDPSSVNYKSSNQPRPILKKSNSSGSLTSSTQTQTSALQKNAFCTKCGVVILYVPVADEETIVKCYQCLGISVFQGDGTTFVSPESVDVQYNTNANARTSGSKGTDMNAKFKGAFKTLKSSQFVKSAKEKSSIAAQKTKEAAQKASHQMAAMKTTSSSKGHKSDSSASPSSPSPSSSSSSPSPAPSQLSPGGSYLFGLPLEEAVRKTSFLIPFVPDLVSKCIEYVRERALEEEGIFRLSGGSQAIKDLKAAFDAGEDVNLSTVPDEHSVTGLLKLYFRELPDPLFPKKFHGEMREVETLLEAEITDQNIQDLAQFVANLPQINRSILYHLMALLNEVAQRKEKNKMSPSNLAIVFSPTLGCSMELLVPLIVHYQSIFEGLYVFS